MHVCTVVYRSAQILLHLPHNDEFILLVTVAANAFRTLVRRCCRRLAHSNQIARIALAHRVVGGHVERVARERTQRHGSLVVSRDGR